MSQKGGGTNRVKQKIPLQVCQIGSVDDIQWGVAGGSDEKTVNQNIIVINRKRQVKIEFSKESLQKSLTFKTRSISTRPLYL